MLQLTKIVMGVFYIGYNLTNIARDYTDFFAELEQDGYARIQSGTCLVVTTENALQLQKRLRSTVDKEASLFIYQVHKNKYSGWATQPSWDWIRKNI